MHGAANDGLPPCLQKVFATATETVRPQQTAAKSAPPTFLHRAAKGEKASPSSWAEMRNAEDNLTL